MSPHLLSALNWKLKVRDWSEIFNYFKNFIIIITIYDVAVDDHGVATLQFQKSEIEAQKRGKYALKRVKLTRLGPKR